MERRFGLGAFQKVQLKLVAQLDDTAHLFTESLAVHRKFILLYVYFIYILLTQSLFHPSGVSNCNCRTMSVVKEC